MLTKEEWTRRRENAQFLNKFKGAKWLSNENNNTYDHYYFLYF